MNNYHDSEKRVDFNLNTAILTFVHPGYRMNLLQAPLITFPASIRMERTFAYV